MSSRGRTQLSTKRDGFSDCLAGSCKHSSINRMASGSRLQVQVMDFFFFSNMLCAVKLRVLGLMVYWYTRFAFHQIPQSYSIIFLPETQSICSITALNYSVQHWRSTATCAAALELVLKFSFSPVSISFTWLLKLAKQLKWYLQSKAI